MRTAVIDAPSTGACTRRAALLLGIGALLLAAGCGAARRDLDGEETRLVAWWVEDVARGMPRSADELATTDPSAALARVHEWASSKPPQLRNRRNRWAAICPLMISGTIVAVEPGLLGVDPSADPGEATLARGLVDAENSDRRMLDSIVLSLVKADPRGSARYRGDVAAARRALDQRAGARPWTGGR